MNKIGFSRCAPFVCLTAVVILCGCAETLQNKKVQTIGHQRLEYVVQGAGTPCVVFESGMGLDMDSWLKVFPETAKFTKALVYNRPGYGRSKPRMGANAGAKIVDELYQLLQKTGCQPPYVLVGHSFGGMFINLFARTYPQDTAGVVFVDSGHPDQGEWSKENMMVRTAIMSMLFHYLQERRAFPGTLYEYYDVDKVSDDVKRGGPFPNVPVRVITSGDPGALVDDSWSQQWSKYQKELTSLSPQGKQIVAKGSGHFIQDERPQLVLGTIREIVEMTRKSNIQR